MVAMPTMVEGAAGIGPAIISIRRTDDATVARAVISGREPKHSRSIPVGRRCNPAYHGASEQSSGQTGSEATPLQCLSLAWGNHRCWLRLIVTPAGAAADGY